MHPITAARQHHLLTAPLRAEFDYQRALTAHITGMVCLAAGGVGIGAVLLMLAKTF